MARGPTLRKCSFCGHTQEETERLFVNMDTTSFICKECVIRCWEILKKGDRKPVKSDQLLTPMQIKALLDQYVIGQDSAKKILSVAVYNHCKRISMGSPVEIEKSNILLVGPTGSGKTLLAKTLARILQVPFAIADATPLTEAGYVGEDVETILLRLIQAADMDLSAAERGIIYIDEVDKIARKMDSPSITRDVSGEGVQTALLKILEGTLANVPPQGGRKHPYQEFLQINTNNILFIAGGAFNGLEKIVSSRVQERPMGFRAKPESATELDKAELFRKLMPEDLLKYGFIPEFVGRFPVTAPVDPLTTDDLVKVLIEPKNSLIKQYTELFRMEGATLEFSRGALVEIARMAQERGTGARGLRSILESLMLDLMYELPEMKDLRRVVISSAVVKGKIRPRFIFEPEAEPPPAAAGGGG